MGPGQRIRQRRKELGLTQTQAAKAAGIAQPTLSEIETGETRMLQGDTLVSLVRVLRTNARWVMLARGRKEDTDLILSEEEWTLVAMYDRLNNQNRSAVLAAIHALYKSQRPDDTSAEDEHHR
jgi:transcriptional regulator with XRE-family HTH domain